MNLSDLMKDISLNNLSWLSEPETYQPKSKDINKKDDLVIEWKTDLNIPEEVPVSTIQTEMVVREALILQIVNCAKVLMHQGIEPKEIINQLTTHFKYEDILEAKPYLKEIFNDAGFIGFYIIDLRNADDEQREKIFKAWKKSKYAHVAKYVLMDEKSIESRHGITNVKSFVANMNAGTIDNFINSSETQQGETVISTHHMFGLPVIAGYEDLPEEDYDDTLIDLVTTGNISDEEKQLAKDEDVINSSKKLYALLKAKEKISTFAPEKSAEYKIKKADNEIEVSSYVAEPQINVDLKKSKIEADVEEQPEENIEIKIVKKSEEMKDVIDVDNQAMIDMEDDLKFAEIEIEPVVMDINFEIEPYQNVDSEFIGTDEFEFDEYKKASEGLEIDHRGSFDF